MNDKLSLNEGMIYKNAISQIIASKNYTVTSLIRFKESFDKRIDMSYIIHPKNLVMDTEIIKMPPYMFSVVI